MLRAVTDARAALERGLDFSRSDKFTRAVDALLVPPKDCEPARSVEHAQVASPKVGLASRINALVAAEELWA